MTTANPHPPVRETSSPPSPLRTTDRALRLLTVLAVIVMLWWGRSFLIPLTAGLMLAMLVSPVTRWLTAAVRSRAVAAALSMLLVLALLAGAAAGFGGQLARVAARVPDMISLVAEQVSDTEPDADSIIVRAREALGALDRATQRISGNKRPVPLSRRAAAAAEAAAASAAAAPVSLSQGATVALRDTAVSGSGALLRFLGDLTLIVFVAFFALAGGQTLTQRYINLWGDDPVQCKRVQLAANECVRQIHFYGGVLLLTNTIVGLTIWAAFAAAGLPDAAGWGMAAAALHVVPYLGMALLTALGAAETYLAHGSAFMALGMAGFIVMLSTLIGTVVTTVLQGRMARMNAAAVFVGVIFWGALWGVWGLLLGPALVVLLKVVATHTPAGHRLAALMEG